MAIDADIQSDIDRLGIARVTLNRPAKRNAMTLAMWRSLGALFLDLNARRDVRGIVLTGAGGNFCSGADISEFDALRQSREKIRAYDEAVQETVRAVRDAPQPTIAAVHGMGIGGGCNLALACDLRIGDRTTRMGISAARGGLVYSESGSELLLRQVGLSNAKLILFSARQFDARQCLALRLIDQLFEDGAAAGAIALAQDIAGNSPMALRGSKLILNSLAAGQIEVHRPEIERTIAVVLDGNDYKEAQAALKEKRRPVFTGE